MMEQSAAATAATPDDEWDTTVDLAMAEEVQRRVFTRWINGVLKRSGMTTIVTVAQVQNLYTDIANGHILLHLMNSLSCGRISTERSLPGSCSSDHDRRVLIEAVLGNIRRELGDVNSSLDVVSASDVCTGSGVAVRALIWHIIQRFHIERFLQSSTGSSSCTDLENTLLCYCQRTTAGYRGVEIINFTTSWSSGLAFNALIHKYHSQWFEYDSLLLQNSHYNLEHAFQLASDRLNVDRLLDIQDMESDRMDKKSVMTFITSCLHALQTTDVTGNPHMTSPDISSPSCLTNAGSQSSLFSIASTVDVSTFNDSLEKVLVWLRDATDAVTSQSPVASDIETLKDQFHRHEEFMVQLTQKQTTVGNVLHDGNCLLQQLQLGENERRVVDTQMTQLSNGWEELRLKAMERQARLQHTLMRLQQDQLDQLSDWLNQMDTRIKNYAVIGGNEEEVRKQIEDIKPLQHEVERQQEKVNSLHSMVVIVDETNAESAYAAMEKQLEELGIRWTVVCRWVAERMSKLNIVRNQWHMFNDRLASFMSWLSDTEDTLAELDQRRQAIDDFQSADINEVVEQVRCLKAIEGDMDVMIKYFDEVNDLGVKVAQHASGNEAAVVKVNSHLQACQERWDNIVQQMELSSKQIAHSGVELVVSTTPTGAQTVTVSRSGGSETVSFSITTSLTSSRPQQPDALAQQKIEFDRHLASLNEWLDQTESTLELVTIEMVNSNDNLTVDEQLVLIEDTDNEIKSHEKYMCELRTLAETLRQQLNSVNEATDAIDSTIRRLESRWSGVAARAVSSRDKILMSSVVSQFFAELESVRSVVTVYDTWATTEGLKIADEFMMLSRQLEQCRVKQKSLLSHESQVSKLNEQAVELLKTGRVPASVEENMKELNDRWTSSIKRLNERHVLLMKAIQKTPPKSFTDALIELTGWIEKREFSLNKSPFIVNDAAQMEQQISQLKEMRMELRDRSGSLDYINHAGQDLLRKVSSGAAEPSTKKLYADLQSLNSRWNQLHASTDERINKYLMTRDQLRHLKNQMDGVSNWVTEIEVFLTSEEAAVGDLDTLQAQFSESQGVQEDIKTMQPTVEGITSVSKMLCSTADPSFEARLTSEVELILGRWSSIIELSRQHTAKLSASITETRGLFSDIAALDSGLEDIINGHLSCELVVHSEVELGQFISNFQRLESELRVGREPELLRIRDKVQTIITVAGQGGAVELTAVMSRLDLKFAEVQQRVLAANNKFQAASSNLAACRRLINEEMKWLNSLEEKLSRGVVSTSADAEELSEEMDDLESFLSGHSVETKDTIASITQSLLNDHIMVSVVTSNLENFNSRQQKVIDEAKQRVEQLEEAIVQAQARETQIVEMSTWMTEVSDLLQTRLDADVLATDTPKEFESLKAEFEQHDACIAELDKDVTTFREQGKVEAANRLENQLAILKKHYSEVVAKFIKFQRPADFDAKMPKVKQLLDEIEEQLSCVEITSSEPDDIQLQLDQCMKVYKTMSEVKSEVEYVIKTGRQIVEKKQVDSPESLNTQLDSIKSLYNELGAQITQGKTSLEQALKLAKKLKKESASLRDFIACTNKELCRRESPTSPKDAEEELTWIKTTTGELNRKQPVLSALSDIISQLTKMADGNVMSTADEAVKQLGIQLSDLLERMNLRKIFLQEKIQHLEQIYVEFETMQRELVIWVDNAEDILHDLDRIKSDSEPTDEDTNRFKALQVEHDQLVTQLDAVRDSAVEIIAHSSRYSKTVEPLLTVLNQRWQEVNTQIKEKQSFFRSSSLKNKHVSITGRVSITPPQTQADNADFDVLVDKLRIQVDHFESDVKEIRDTDCHGDAGNLECKLRKLDSTEEEIEKQIANVERQLNQSHQPHDGKTAVQQTEQIKVQWKNLHEESLHARLSSACKAFPEFSKFLKISEDIKAWLSSVEAKLTEADSGEQKMKDFHKEFFDKQLEVEQLNGEACKMPSSVVVQVNVVESLEYINGQMQTLRRRLELFPADTQLSSAAGGSQRLKISAIEFSTESGEQFMSDIARLDDMISIVEDELKTPLIQNYTFEFSTKPEDELELIENALSAIQSSYESALLCQEILSSPEENEQRSQSLNNVQLKLMDLRYHVDERKCLEETMSIEQFVSMMNEVSTWLKEVSVTVNSCVNPTDQSDIDAVLLKLKEDAIRLKYQQRKLRSLGRSGRQMYYAALTSAEDKSRISHDLTSTIELWNSVACKIPIRRKQLEDKLIALNELMVHIEKIDEVIQKLGTVSATSDLPEVMLFEENKVIADILKTGQSNMNSLSEKYATLKLAARDARVPDRLFQRVDKVCSEWATAESQAVKLLPLGVTSKSDSDLFQQDIEMIEPMKAPKLSAANETVTSLSSPPSDVDNGYDQFVNSLKIEVENDRPSPVVIGNIDDIEQAIKEIKVRLSELDRTGSQLISLYEQKSSGSATTENQVSQLRNLLEHAKIALRRRSLELEDLLLECRQYTQMVDEFERWVNVIQEDCEAQASEAATACFIPAIERLIGANKQLEAEAVPWENKVSSLRDVAYKLIENYPSEDPSQIKVTVNRLENKWTGLLMSLASQDRHLQKTLESVTHFESDLKEFMLWLTKAEVILMHHDEMTMANSECTDSEQQWNKLENSFKDLQKDVQRHRGAVQALNSTGNLIMQGYQKSGTSESGQLKDQMKEMNDRWNRVNERSIELRARLEVQTNPTSEMLQLLNDNINWLKNINEEISNKFQLIGDTFLLRAQHELSEAIRGKLDCKKLSIEGYVRSGRLSRVKELYLFNDPADNSESQKDAESNIVDTAAAEQLVVQIHKQADLLFDIWTKTNVLVHDWQQQITSTKQRVRSLESLLSECANFVSALEREASAWRQNIGTSLGLSQLQLDYSQVKSFQRDLRSLQAKIASVRSNGQDFEKQDVKLSPKISNAINKVENRVAALEKLSSERISRLTSSLREFGPSSQNILLQSVNHPWERLLVESSKVPYYINHSSEQTQWDHPEMTNTLHSISEVNGVKFSAYRTSMKLRLLQKKMKLDLLDLNKAIKELDELGMMCYNSARQLNVAELVSYSVSLLTGVVDKVDGDDNGKVTCVGSEPDDVSLCADLILNWLLNVYDQGRSGHISLLSFTAAIILMCKGHVEDKCKALFRLVSDSNGKANESRMCELLRQCIQIPRQLGEIAAFGGSNVEPSVKSCFEKAGSRQEIEVSHFVEWMKMEPQSMVWLPVLHRLAASESAKHQAKCSACKECPIKGFRYRCLKCFRFDMCQRCFFSGRKAKNHKLTHPMQEYCTASTSGEDMRDFTKMFKNKFRTKRYFKKHPRLGYLPVQPDLDGGTLQRRIAVASFEQEVQPTVNAGTSGSGSSTPSDTSSRIAVKIHQGNSNAAPAIIKQISSSSQEMHLRLELYANRLAEVERKRRETTPDWEDEHTLISQYCQRLHGTDSTTNTLQSPMQIMLAIDADQKLELESMIQELEDENRALQNEYDQLKRAHTDHVQRSSFNSDVIDDVISENNQNGVGDGEIIAEARLLRQHKGRLEARMRVLEDHNEQLDSQLRHLRHLLNNSEEMSYESAGDARILTYPHAVSSAADVSCSSSHSSLPRRAPPPSFTSAFSDGRLVNNGEGGEDLGNNENMAAQYPSDQDPVVSEIAYSSRLAKNADGGRQMNDLLLVAGEVGKAVESLVNIMTDDEQEQEEELERETPKQILNSS